MCVQRVALDEYIPMHIWRSQWLSETHTMTQRYRVYAAHMHTLYPYHEASVDTWHMWQQQPDRHDFFMDAFRAILSIEFDIMPTQVWVRYTTDTTDTTDT
jgi:hypothetical protein